MMRLTLPLIFLFSLTALALPPGVTSSYHKDHRKGTPKLEFLPSYQGLSGSAKRDTLVRFFLQQQANRYGLPADLHNLELQVVRKSLLGEHFHFIQKRHGLEVLGGGIAVSVSEKDNAIYMVYNTIYPDAVQKAFVGPKISEEEAYDIAWKDLHVSGPLTAAPTTKLAYLPKGSEFRLVYRTELTVERPQGPWRYTIDAVSGDILNVETLLQARNPIQLPPRSERMAHPLLDRSLAFKQFEMEQSTKAKHPVEGKRAEGSGYTFDPDPRTTLNTQTLFDDSPASAFEDAYFNVPLRDITESNGVFSLSGPWIHLVDFEAPFTAPSTKPDGVWTEKRGNIAFNDTMTYYHIDKNQRYIQALGFVEERGIQNTSIGVDTNARSGQDNSFFQGGVNQLGFGHGCVDDNEDADVILHEYGHGIQWWIVNNNDGAHWRAIGEGFGDYWAGSYSYSTPNGPVFNPNWIFSWDGHNSCWPGRVMNATHLRYDPERAVYSDHQSIPGGQTDELWSTPLFQTLVELVESGKAREDVDRIVLQSHFGLGANITMRELAKATVFAAEELHPGDIFHTTFGRWFRALNILDDPAVDLVQGNVAILAAGTDNIPEPGETVTFSLELTNIGELGVTSATASLSTDAVGVNFAESQINLEKIPLNTTTSASTDLTIPLTHPCGQAIPINLEVVYQDENSQSGQVSFEYSLLVGEAVEIVASVSPNMDIPDNDNAGIVSTLVVPGENLVVKSSFSVDVNITHEWRGDIGITIVAPDGTGVVLKEPSFDASENIQGNYPQTLTPVGNLGLLVGKPLNGEWELRVFDGGAMDLGALVSWGIRDLDRYECQTDTSGEEPTVALYVPYLVTDSQWQSRLGLVNPGVEAVNGRISALDAAGNVLETSADFVINPNGRIFASAAEIFPATDTSQIAAAKVLTTERVVGYIDVVSNDRSMSFAVPTTEVLYQNLNVPHVAEDPSFWTRGQIHNGSDQNVSLEFLATGTNSTTLALSNPGGSQAVDFRADFFGETIPNQTGWGILQNGVDVGSGALSGVEIFGQAPENSNASGLALSDFASTTIVFPHIPADKSVWWSGLVLVNLNELAANVTGRVYDGNGQVIAERSFEIAPRTKVVNLLEGYFPDADVSTGQWVQFDADQALTGYQLFGTNNPDQGYAGLEAVSEGATTYYIPHVETSAGGWTGLGILNWGDSEAIVSFTGYDDAGNLVSAPRLHTFGAKSKQVGLHNSYLTASQGVTWIRVTSDQPLIVLELYGENGTSRVSGINALR